MSLHVKVAAKVSDSASYTAPTPDDDDLLGEFVAAVANVNRPNFDALEAVGVPHDFLWCGPMRFGVAMVMPAIPLSAENDDIGDLVAFRLSDPTRWWLRNGSVPILNPLAILRAETMRERLRVLATPLAWLQGGGEGVVILDWSVNLLLHLSGVRKGLIVDEDDVQLARDLKQRLPGPSAPRIFIRRRSPDAR